MDKPADEASADGFPIRPFIPSDTEETAGVWHRAGKAGYPYLPNWQALTLEKAVRVFGKHIIAHKQVWVGLNGGTIVAFLALAGSTIDRLYVDPPHWRKGWGSRFVALAKTQSPDGLELVTHQANAMARALYEKKGFRAFEFGMSPPPESAPDVRYRWSPRPKDSTES